MAHPVSDIIEREFETGDRLKVVFKTYSQSKVESDGITGYFHYYEQNYFVIFTDRAEVYNEEIKDYEYQLQGERVIIPFDNVLYVKGPIII